MEKDLSLNQIEIGIAEVQHNLECVEEAQQKASGEEKAMYTSEKQRLTKLLKKLLKVREGMK